MFDLDAYLKRIGLSGSPQLSAVHRAHALNIPFENLDPQRGVPARLDPESLQSKLVEARRGGYCFEHNLLLANALEALGARVEPMLARVRWGFPAGVVNPLTHLVLRVTLEGRQWMADVGFGAGTLIEPIPFGPGGPYEQSGWLFRVTEEEDLLVLQSQTEEGWRDVYAFLPRPAERIDMEVSNWYVSTSPESVFVKGLIATTTRPDGTRVALSDWSGELQFVERAPTTKSSREVARDEVPALLAEHFRLPGFALGEGGRIVTAGAAAESGSAEPTAG